MKKRRVQLILCLIVVLYMCFLGVRRYSDVHSPRTQPRRGSLIDGSVNDDIIWFIQVSDVHVWAESGFSSVLSLSHFINFTARILHPSALILTGDMTKAVKHYAMQLSEDKFEWESYQRVIEQWLSTNEGFWLDLPGNHDNFDEDQLVHYRSLYSTSRLAGSPNNYHPHYAGATRIKYADDARHVSLIPIDASLSPGIKLSNFLGYMSDESISSLTALINDAQLKGDDIIFYGHYPLGTIVSAQPLETVLSVGKAYLCGHLHTAFGFAPTMWRRIGNFLEIELPDWFTNSLFRVVTLDGGKLNWFDIKEDTWPLVFVTSLSAFGTDRKSYLLRMLVFSVNQIQKVRAKMHLREDELIVGWIDCIKQRENMYYCWLRNDVLSFFLESEDQLLQSIQVRIETDKGSTELKYGDPGFRGTSAPPSLLGYVLLSIKFHAVYGFFFATGLAACFTILLGGKYPIIVSHVPIPQTMIKGAEAICSNKKLYYLMLIFLLYPLVGFWYIGRLAGNQQGVVFMWNIYVGGKTLPGQLTYPDAFFLVYFLQLPLCMLIIAKYGCKCPSPEIERTLNVCYIVINLLQVPSIIAWIVYDSLHLNGPLRSALMVVGYLVWRGSDGRRL